MVFRGEMQPLQVKSDRMADIGGIKVSLQIHAFSVCLESLWQWATCLRHCVVVSGETRISVS